MQLDPRPIWPIFLYVCLPLVYDPKLDGGILHFLSQTMRMNQYN